MSDEKAKFLDEVMRYVVRRYGGESGYGMNAVPVKLVSGLFSRRARKLFDQSITEVLESDPRFYVHWHSKGARLVAPRERVMALVDAVPGEHRMLMIGRLFGDLVDGDKGQELVID